MTVAAHTVASAKEHAEDCSSVLPRLGRIDYSIHWDGVAGAVLRWLEGRAADPHCRKALAEAGEVISEHLAVGSKKKLADLTSQAPEVRVVLVELRYAVTGGFASFVLSL